MPARGAEVVQRPARAAGRGVWEKESRLREIWGLWGVGWRGGRVLSQRGVGGRGGRGEG